MGNALRSLNGRNKLSDLLEEFGRAHELAMAGRD